MTQTLFWHRISMTEMHVCLMYGTVRKCIAGQNKHKSDCTRSVDVTKDSSLLSVASNTRNWETFSNNIS